MRFAAVVLVMVSLMMATVSEVSAIVCARGASRAGCAGLHGVWSRTARLAVALGSMAYGFVADGA